MDAFVIRALNKVACRLSHLSKLEWCAESERWLADGDWLVDMPLYYRQLPADVENTAFPVYQGPSGTMVADLVDMPRTIYQIFYEEEDFCDWSERLNTSHLQSARSG